MLLRAAVMPMGRAIPVEIATEVGIRERVSIAVGQTPTVPISKRLTSVAAELGGSPCGCIRRKG